MYVAALPALGLGMALKIDDGAMRAAECAAVHILRGLKCFTASEEQRLKPFFYPAIKTDAGEMAAQSVQRLCLSLRRRPEESYHRECGPALAVTPQI